MKEVREGDSKMEFRPFIGHDLAWLLEQELVKAVADSERARTYARRVAPKPGLSYYDRQR